MTYEDKKKLSKSIETLAPEKAAKVVKIIQSRMDLSMNNGNEEVEIDIDTLPNDTLLELQAYVNKCNQPKRAGAPMVSVHKLSSRSGWVSHNNFV